MATEADGLYDEFRDRVLREVEAGRSGNIVGLCRALVEARPLQQGDIVQITDETHAWYPCLIIVDEVKSWGIQGFTIIPTNDQKPNGRAYIRLKSAVYERVGIATLVPGPEPEEVQDAGTRVSDPGPQGQT